MSRQIPIPEGFGRLFATGKSVSFPVQIEQQNGLSSAVYRMMECLCAAQLPITEYDFIRMWKSIILKRVHDVEYGTTCVRPTHYRYLYRMDVPAPLGDLVQCLGQFKCESLGIVVNIKAPGNQGEHWWEMDGDLIQKWMRTMTRLKPLYAMKEFPSRSDISGAALPFVFMKDEGGYRTVNTYTNEPTPEEVFVAFVNDPLFLSTDEFSYDTCGWNGPQGCVSGYRGSYVGSYVLDTKA